MSVRVDQPFVFEPINKDLNTTLVSVRARRCSAVQCLKSDLNTTLVSVRDKKLSDNEKLDRDLNTTLVSVRGTPSGTGRRTLAQFKYNPCVGSRSPLSNSNTSFLYLNTTLVSVRVFQG